jgi:hypothetical protein
MLYTRKNQNYKVEFFQLYLRDGSMEKDEEYDTSSCPVFGVRSGGPLIGLGILIILFGVIPFLVDQIPLPVVGTLIFIGFGIFLIWVGLTQ